MANIEGTSATRLEESPETRAAEYKGLCETCMHAPNCTFPRKPEQPILFCEEFETYSMPEMKDVLSDHPLAVDASPGAAAGKTDPERFAGLCVNCAHRETCTFPMLEGGIWHCEEYE